MSHVNARYDKSNMCTRRRSHYRADHTPYPETQAKDGCKKIEYTAFLIESITKIILFVIQVYFNYNYYYRVRTFIFHALQHNSF